VSRPLRRLRVMGLTAQRRNHPARYFEDCRIYMTNNVAERALRGIALGRKSHGCCGMSDRGGERPAVMLTLTQTAKLNNVDSQGLASRCAGPDPSGRSVVPTGCRARRLVRSNSSGSQPR
jgi:Transposase IS66 family